MSIPDASTRLCGVVGHPVGHSLSPQIHNAALRHEGRNGIYLAFDVPPESFEAAMRGLGLVGAVGVSVTIPHKLAAVELASSRTPECERVGAANVLVFGKEGAEAHNTDVAGVLKALAELRLDPEGATCLVLGAGGAARAAGWALAQAGAERIEVANRTPQRARELVETLAGSGSSVAEVAWTERDAKARGSDLIINATSVGLDGRESPLDMRTLEGAALGACRGVLDLVYGVEETPLVRAARRAGLATADGLGMLVYQATEAYRWFWGHEPDVDVMMEAARSAVGRPVGAV